MGLISLTCPACGAQLDNLDDSRDTYFCTYCGNKITHETIIVKHQGEISLTGVASEKTLLQRAYNFLEEYNYPEAKSYFDRVLDINPRCASAYMGLLMCKYKVPTTEHLLIATNIDFSTDIDYRRAVQYSSGEENKRYKDVNGYAHQFCMEIMALRKELDDGMKKMVRERDEAEKKLIEDRTQAEKDLKKCESALNNISSRKASADKRYRKEVIKRIIIILVFIVLTLVSFSFNNVLPLILGFFTLVMILVELIKIVDLHKWIYSDADYKRQIMKKNQEYGDITNALSNLNGKIQILNPQFEQNMQAFIAQNSKEKKACIEKWRQIYPEIEKVLYNPLFSMIDHG